MTKTEDNKFSMYASVERTLAAYQKLIDGKPMLKESTAKFKEVLNELREKDNDYQNAKKGKTADKDGAAERLIEELMMRSGILYVYARKIGNGNLKALSELTRSGLMQLRENDFMQKANVILEQYKANLEGLKTNGITEESYAEFESKVKKYSNAVNEKDLGMAEGKASRRDLKDIFNEMDDILRNDLDRLIEMVKSENIDLYNQYKDSRHIKDQASPKTTSSKVKSVNS